MNKITLLILGLLVHTLNTYGTNHEKQNNGSASTLSKQGNTLTDKNPKNIGCLGVQAFDKKSDITKEWSFRDDNSFEPKEWVLVPIRQEDIKRGLFHKRVLLSSSTSPRPIVVKIPATTGSYAYGIVSASQNSNSYLVQVQDKEFIQVDGNQLAKFNKQ